MIENCHITFQIDYHLFIKASMTYNVLDFVIVQTESELFSLRLIHFLSWQLFLWEAFWYFLPWYLPTAVTPTQFYS